MEKNTSFDKLLAKLNKQKINNIKEGKSKLSHCPIPKIQRSSCNQRNSCRIWSTILCKKNQVTPHSFEIQIKADQGRIFNDLCSLLLYPRYLRIKKAAITNFISFKGLSVCSHAREQHCFPQWLALECHGQLYSFALHSTPEHLSEREFNLVSLSLTSGFENWEREKGSKYECVKRLLEDLHWMCCLFPQKPAGVSLRAVSIIIPR